MKLMRLLHHINGPKRQLEKLNNDSNCTAGLEAELTLAVGARVMLQRNIDTKQGFAIGTVSFVHG